MHPRRVTWSLHLSLDDGGQALRLLYVPADLAEEVERRVALSHRIEGSLAELSAINVELMLRGELD